MAFYQLDKESSGQDEYKLILDEMDTLVDNFIIRLNNYTFGRNIDSDQIVITNMSQQPFVKATKDILTGYILTFTITVADQFNYCGLGC